MSDSAKVREAGAERRRDELPEAIRRELAHIWQSDVTPHTGFADCAALDAELRRIAGGATE